MRQRAVMRPSGGALLALCLLAACDSAPGFEDAATRDPLVDNLLVAPGEVVLEDLPTTQVSRDSVTIPLQVEADVVDPENNLRDVVMSVRTLSGALTPLLTRPMTRVSGTRYRADATLRLPVRAGRGTYTVAVYATDASGALGLALGRLVYRTRGVAPVVARGEASPSPFANPTGNTARTLTLTAVVSDADGLDDVLRVEAILPDGSAFRMFDDGKTSGDPTAGDGRYTAAFLVTSANPLPTGDLTFVLRATDKNNLRSTDVPLTVTVQ